MSDPGSVTKDGFALPRRQVALLMTGVFAGVMLSALDQVVVSTALPRIVGEIGGLDQLSWLVTAYLLTSMASTPLWGKLSDMYGRRLMFQLAIGTFIVASLLCGIAQNIVELIAFRAVQGIGAGGLFVLALSVVGDVVPPAARAGYQGYFGAVFGIASVAGPVLGGWLAEGPGWRWAFFINVPIGLLSLVAVTVLLRLPVTRRGHTIDYRGAVLIVLGVAALLFALNWSGPGQGWADPITLVLLVVVVLLVAAVVLVERRASEPIIPVTLFGLRVFSTGSLFAFLVGAVQLAPVVFVSIYLQQAQGFSPVNAGLGLAPLMVGTTLTVTTSGKLISRIGRYKVFPVVGCALLVVSTALLSQLRVDTPYWQVAVVTFLLGAGVGMSVQPVLTAVQNGVEMKDMGAAIGAVAFFQRLGGAIGVAVFSAVFSVQLAGNLARGALPAGVDASDPQAVQALPEPVRGAVLGAFADALGDLFLAMVPFVVLAFVVALFLREVPVKRAAPTAPRKDSASPS